MGLDYSDKKHGDIHGEHFVGDFCCTDKVSLMALVNSSATPYHKATCVEIQSSDTLSDIDPECSVKRATFLQETSVFAYQVGHYDILLNPGGIMT